MKIIIKTVGNGFVEYDEKELTVNQTNKMFEDLNKKYGLHWESSSNVIYLDKNKNVIEMFLID